MKIEFNQICLTTRRYDIVECKQRRCRPACTPAQSGQHLLCLLSRKFDSLTYYMPYFNIQASPCGWVGWFECNLVRNPKDRFWHIEGQIIPVSAAVPVMHTLRTCLLPSYSLYRSVPNSVFCYWPALVVIVCYKLIINIGQLQLI